MQSIFLRKELYFFKVPFIVFSLFSDSGVQVHKMFPNDKLELVKTKAFLVWLEPFMIQKFLLSFCCQHLKLSNSLEFY